MNSPEQCNGVLPFCIEREQISSWAVGCVASAHIIQCAGLSHVAYLRMICRCKKTQSHVDKQPDKNNKELEEENGMRQKKKIHQGLSRYSVTLRGREERSQLCQASCLHTALKDGPWLFPRLMITLEA